MSSSLTKNFVFGMILLLSACSHASDNELKGIQDNASNHGAFYGMAKKCNLPEAQSFDDTYRRYLKEKFGLANVVAYTKTLRVYEYFAQEVEAGQTPPNCVAIKDSLPKLIDALNQEIR